MPGVIYRMDDPITYKIRYIGKTVNMKQRMYAHINASLHQNKSNSAKDAWIQFLHNNGLEPMFQVVENVENTQLIRIRETYWIRHYKNRGANLLNIEEAVTIDDILYHCKQQQTDLALMRSIQRVPIRWRVAYNIKDLVNSLPASLEEISSTLRVPTYGLLKFIEGEPVGMERAELILLFLSWVCGRAFYLTNIQGICVKSLF